MAILKRDGTPVRPPKIVILVPSHEYCPVTFAIDLAQLYMETAIALDDGVDLGLFGYVGTYLHTQRELLIREALEQGATHVLWLDSDMRFPSNALVRLLARNVPAVGINYSTRSPTPTFTAIRDGLRVSTDDTKEGLEEVDSLGMGCFLVRYDALRDLPSDRPWFWFERDETNGQHVGEDVYFCRLLREAGHTIYLDHDLSKECKHIGLYEYGIENVIAFREAMEQIRRERGAA